MSETDDTSTPVESESPAADANLSAPSVDGADAAPAPEIAVNSAVFPPLGERGGSDSAIPLDRFYDVTVRVWAELGQVTLPIGDLLQLGEGAVVKLSRPVSDPVDLMAQGVRFAKGEVVVVDDCFAIRITEIDSDQVPGKN